MWAKLKNRDIIGGAFPSPMLQPQIGIVPGTVEFLSMKVLFVNEEVYLTFESTKVSLGGHN
jgi:hypothetical protein